MSQPATCGEGLARNARLPITLAEVAAGLAETLETHLPSLVLDDENARREHAVYVGLSKDLRQAAVLLQASGAEMERARELPEAEHDARKLASPDARDAFGRFVRAEETLASLLGQRLEADRAMTRQMDEAPARG
jgi:hypothetical protein